MRIFLFSIHNAKVICVLEIGLATGGVPRIVSPCNRGTVTVRSDEALQRTGTVKAILIGRGTGRQGKRRIVENEANLRTRKAGYSNE